MSSGVRRVARRAARATRDEHDSVERDQRERCIASVHCVALVARVSHVARGRGIAARIRAPGTAIPTDDDEVGARQRQRRWSHRRIPRRAPTWLSDQLAAALAGAARRSPTRRSRSSSSISRPATELLRARRRPRHEPRVEREAADLDGRARDARRRVPLADRGVRRRARRATGVVDGDLYVRGRGDPMLSAATCARSPPMSPRAACARSSGQLVDRRAATSTTRSSRRTSRSRTEERAGFRAPVASFGVARSAVTVDRRSPIRAARATVRARARRRRLRQARQARGHERHDRPHPGQASTRSRSPTTSRSRSPARSGRATAATTCASASTIPRGSPARCSGARSPTTA